MALLVSCYEFFIQATRVIPQNKFEILLDIIMEKMFICSHLLLNHVRGKVKSQKIPFVDLFPSNNSCVG